MARHIPSSGPGWLHLSRYGHVGKHSQRPFESQKPFFGGTGHILECWVQARRVRGHRAAALLQSHFRSVRCYHDHQLRSAAHDVAHPYRLAGDSAVIVKRNPAWAPPQNVFRRCALVAVLRGCKPACIRKDFACNAAIVHCGCYTTPPSQSPPGARSYIQTEGCRPASSTASGRESTQTRTPPRRTRTPQPCPTLPWDPSLAAGAASPR